MGKNKQQLYTASDIWRLCGYSRDTVLYYLRSREVKPFCKFGNTRLYTPEQAEAIDRELKVRSKK
jgi:DNA-binding transcriptional MerR regulator